MRDAISLLTLAFFAPVAAGAAGCVSNEYVIPHDELVHLASAPPESRGVRVHAVQSIGERRSDAIAPPAQFLVSPPAPPRDLEDEGSAPLDAAPDLEGREMPDIHIQMDGVVQGGSDGGPRHVGARPGLPRGGTSSWVAPGRTHAPNAAPTVRGSAQPHVGGASGGGGWSTGGGGGGSGNNAGEVLVVLAVVAVAVAALAMIGLMASEGARFDGQVEMSPDQPVHLEDQSGALVVVPLGAITEAQAASTVTARVMDDEGPGLRLLERHLDRRGFTFKLDFGTLAFQPDSSHQTFNGLTSHLQVGYFLTPHIGLLATAGLGGADDGLRATLTRHELGLELQAFPLALGPLHLGVYANGGLAVLGTTAAEGMTRTGKAAGGGLLVELDVTGRMALTLRAGADVARFDGGWSPAGTVAAGVAIY